MPPLKTGPFVTVGTILIRRKECDGGARWKDNACLLLIADVNQRRCTRYHRLAHVLRFLRIFPVLIAFFSKGYPLPKAKEYVQLRKPFILNDLGMQALLQDRRRVYDLLEASGIDVPRHAYMSRDGYVSTGTGAGNGCGDTEVAEFDDHIEINGISIHKPFVEKPVRRDKPLSRLWS